MSSVNYQNQLKDFQYPPNLGPAEMLADQLWNKSIQKRPDVALYGPTFVRSQQMAALLDTILHCTSWPRGECGIKWIFKLVSKSAYLQIIACISSD